MKKVFLGAALFLFWNGVAGGQTVLPGDIFVGAIMPSQLPFQLPGLDLNFSGAGARARGMGGAFLTQSGDMSAVTFNPAGLAGLDRTQMTLVYKYNRPGVQSRQFGGASGALQQEAKNVDSFDQFDFGAVASPYKLFGHPFVGAAAFSTLADQFFADQTNLFGPTLFDTFVINTNQSFNRRTSGKLSAFNLGGAGRFGPFSFGATFQVFQGGFSDTLDVLVGPFQQRKSEDRPLEPTIEKVRLANKSSYRGSNLILGAQWAYKKARLAAAGRIPAFTLGETDLFRLKANMDIGFFDSTFFSGLLDLNRTGGLLFFTDSRLELPLSLSGGISYRFGPSLLAAFDYTYTNWGAADLKVRRRFVAPFSNPATLVLGNAPVQLTSTHQLRLGWEYGFDPGFGRMFLRGGVRNIPFRTLPSISPHSFVPEFVDSFVLDSQGNVIDTISTARLIYLSASEDAAADGFGLSGGLGVRWNQIALDAAYDYSTYLRTSRRQTAASGTLTTFQRQRQHRIFVGFTGYFTRL